MPPTGCSRVSGEGNARSPDIRNHPLNQDSHLQGADVPLQPLQTLKDLIVCVRMCWCKIRKLLVSFRKM